MANVASIVDRTLRAAGIPILGVSIGDPAVRATWVIQFDPSATTPQRTSGATILTTVVVDASAQAVQDQLDAQAAVDALPIWAKALALAIIDQLNVIRAALPSPLPPITVPQAIAAIRAKAGTL